MELKPDSLMVKGKEASFYACFCPPFCQHFLFIFIIWISWTHMQVSWSVAAIHSSHRSLTMVLILDGNSETGVHVRQSLMFDLFRAFDRIEWSHKFGFFLYKYLSVRPEPQALWPITHKYSFSIVLFNYFHVFHSFDIQVMKNAIVSRAMKVFRPC